MALDEPSAQLCSDLRSSVQSALAAHRPILHHLNADTTWLLQIPRPDSAIRHGSRFYYNILIDPWLQGGQSDVASWFSQQFHATPSAVGTIAEVEELIKEVEILANGLRPLSRRKSNHLAESDELEEEESYIDVVAISHEFTDHCHKQTLLEVHPNVPVFTINEAAKLINAWKHFRTVVIVPAFGADDNLDWRSTSVAPLPPWLAISRLLQKDDVLYYHSALMIAFNNRDTLQPTFTSEDEAAEAVMYTPHGIHSGDLHLIPQANPPIKTLALLHGLHNVRVGTATGATALQSNLGAHNGLKAQRILRARYWIGTHDEIKTGRGLVSWFLQRDIISVKDALELERKNKALSAGASSNGELDTVLDSFEGTNWLDLSNGQSKILV